MSIDLDAFDEFEARAWEERVEGYAGFFAAVTGRLVDPLLDSARVGPGTRVLDVASGPGYLAAEAARRGAAVCGVDVAEAMVVRARREHPGVEFRRADAQSLPFAGGAFDAVVANQGLVDVEVRRVAFTHPVESFDDLWHALQHGTVRMASLVRGQSEETRERIRSPSSAAWPRTPSVGDSTCRSR